MDMFVVGKAPLGHFHTDQFVYADVWAAVTPPEGWTHQDTDRPRAALADTLED